MVGLKLRGQSSLVKGPLGPLAGHEVSLPPETLGAPHCQTSSTSGQVPKSQMWPVELCRYGNPVVSGMGFQPPQVASH